MHQRSDSVASSTDQRAPRPDRTAGTGRFGPHPPDDAGYVLALVALIIFALLLLVGLVVDVGGWYSKASQEQRAADAAALAGASTLADGGTFAEARTEALRIARQNGFRPRGTVSIAVTPVGTDGVKVNIEEGDVQLFFASLVLSNVAIEREAVASPATCGAVCDQDIEIGRPFSGITLAGDGDGFSPTLVGAEKVFALNHHASPGRDSMLCIERATNAPCAAASGGTYPKQVDAYTSFTSTMEYYAPLNALYYTHQTSSDVRLGCWSVTTDAPCGTATLAALPRGSNDQHSWVRAASPRLVGNRAYILTDDYNMHCVVLASLAPCGAPVPSGYVVQVAAGNMPANAYSENRTRGNRNNTFTIDQEVIGSRIYTAYALRATPNQNGTWVACFDTAANTPCADWTTGAVRFPAIGSHSGSADRPWSNHPYLFTRYSTAGAPNGVCTHDAGSHGCVEIGGPGVGSVQSTIPGFNTALAKNITKWHTSEEARLGNRTFFPDQRANSTNCWNWSTSSGCGTKFWGSSPDPTGSKNTSDYGYASDGNCIFGLGHDTLFWSFDENYDQCIGGGTTVEVMPCTCSTGEQRYGVLQVPTDVLPNLLSIKVTVHSAVGNTVLIPETDILPTGGTLDLGSIDAAAHPLVRLTLDLRPRAGYDTAATWTDAITAATNVSTRPVLVD